MAQNAKLFKKFIEENNIPMNINENLEEGFTVFEIPEEYANAKTIIAFNNDDSTADMYIFNFANVINDDVTKANLYKVLNDLNSTYKYISFYEGSNTINAKCSIPFNYNFNAQLVFDILSVLIRSVEEEFDGIMKAIWNN